MQALPLPCVPDLCLFSSYYISTSFSISYNCTFYLTSFGNALQVRHCLCGRCLHVLLSWCPTATSRFLSESRQLSPRDEWASTAVRILQRKGDDKRDGQTGRLRNSGPTLVFGAGPATESRGNSIKRKRPSHGKRGKSETAREVKALPLRTLQDKLT